MQNMGDESGRKRKISEFDLRRDIMMGREAVAKIAESSWWIWDLGSSLLFWRWKGLERYARDGFPRYLIGKLPSNMKQLRPPKKEERSIIAKKLQRVIHRGYIKPLHVVSLTFFAVPKGIDDIRLVYNGTSCGLNDAIWVTSFWFPTPDSALRNIGPNTFLVDANLGDMFLNFPMEQQIVEHSEIYLSNFANEFSIKGVKSSGWIYLSWFRQWMGLRSSPLFCILFYYLTVEFILGDTQDPNHPFHWT